MLTWLTYSSQQKQMTVSVFSVCSSAYPNIPAILPGYVEGILLTFKLFSPLTLYESKITLTFNPCADAM